MDLTHLRLTGMAIVGQQYGAVGLVPFPERGSPVSSMRRSRHNPAYMRPSPSCRLSPPSPAILSQPSSLEAGSRKGIPHSHLILHPEPEESDGKPQGHPGKHRR